MDVERRTWDYIVPSVGGRRSARSECFGVSARSQTGSGTAKPKRGRVGGGRQTATAREPNPAPPAQMVFVLL